MVEAIWWWKAAGTSNRAVSRCGQSITDACIGWADTETLLTTLADGVKARRAKRWASRKTPRQTDKPRPRPTCTHDGKTRVDQSGRHG